MPLDLLGPANATNFTTVRPADTRVFGADDTYFKDCTPGARDGTAVQAGYLNGVLMQLRRAIRGMAITENNADDDMLLKAIQAAAAGLIPEVTVLANMPIHALVGTGGVVAYSTGAGNIVVSPGQTITRRGARVYNLDNLSLANRTFVTLASKTYHLRWYAPGIGRATPSASWPDGRLYLEDIADPTYNPSVLAEANVAFDSTYDSLILARVVTSGANTLTVTPLTNKPFLRGSATKASFHRQSGGWSGLPDLTSNINWSRQPLVSVPNFSVEATVGNEGLAMITTGATRYTANCFIAGYSDVGVDGYISGTCTIDLSA